jgi:CHAT domain-containing protein
MRVGFLVLMLLSLLGTGFAAQVSDVPTIGDVFTAVASGQSADTLRIFESRALKFEDLARSDDSPSQYLEAATITLQRAALLAMYAGQYQKSVFYGERMLALATQLRNPRLKLVAAIRLQVAFDYIRNFTKAAEYVDLGFDLIRELPENSVERSWFVIVLLQHRGDVYQRLGKYEQAVEWYRRAIDAADSYAQLHSATDPLQDGRRILWHQTQARNYQGLGDVYYSSGNFEMALESYQRGLDVFQDTPFKQWRATLLIGIGALLRQRGDFAGALANARNALDQLRLERRRAMIAHAAGLVGETLRESGKPAESIHFYRESIEQIEFVRSSIISNDNRQWYFSDWTEIYAGMISALSNTAAHDSAFDVSERARSRSFLDLLSAKVQFARQTSEVAEQRLQFSQRFAAADFATESLAADRVAAREIREGITETERSYKELLNKIRKEDREQASLMVVEPLTSGQVQALLEPEQALIEYFVTPARIYLWVVDKKQLRSLSVGRSRSELIQRLEALRNALAERKPLKEYQTFARDLYQQLIAPAESLIMGKELIIVPHDVLHNLPFHALVGNDGRYLIEKHPVQYLSSASLMQFTQGKRRALGNKVLAFGNPATNNSVKELKFAEQETAQLKKLFPATTLFRRNEATKTKVKSLAHDYDILHFAAHTELKQDDPLSSAVLLAKSNSDNGRLEVRDIFALDLNASLVVLSGCETALGKLSSGDELVGLTRAFIYAGTPSVVASLWKVDDASTAQLMSSFYRNLKSKTKVESLRQAQLDLIRGKVNSQLLAQRGVGGVAKLGETPGAQRSPPWSVSLSHPYFWAPFILVGDGK